MFRDYIVCGRSFYALCLAPFRVRWLKWGPMGGPTKLHDLLKMTLLLDVLQWSLYLQIRLYE